MSNYVVGVKVTGDAAGLAKAAQEAQKAIDGMAVVGAKGIDNMGKKAKETETSLVSMSTRSQREFARMAQARETLGIRSEQRIQREIQRTQAAYQRLTASGTMSWREQRRAADEMRQTVLRLNNEMGVYSSRQRLVAGAQRAGMVIAGVAAGAAVVAPKISKALTYDQQLAHMANTAYGDPSLPAAEDRARRMAGRSQMDQAIRDAIRYGGGTPEDAAENLNSLLSSGKFKADDALTIFREAQRAATANAASGADFAQIAFAANSTFGIKPEEMKRAFGIATYAGQSGAFEIKDMARYLPGQMALAGQLGMSGLGGFAKITALNQAARLTAGTSDEAGNNVINLLGKIGSDDTRTTFSKLGINLSKRLAEGRMKGLDALDVTANIVDEQLSKNKNYQAARKALTSATNDDDRRTALESVAKIVQGSEISKLFADRQALMALLGFVGNRGMVGDIAKGSLLSGTDAVDRNMWTVEGSPSWDVNQAAQAAYFANIDAMEKLSPVVSTVAGGFADLAKEYPVLAAGASAASTALQGLAAVAGGIGLASLVLGGKGAASGGFISKLWNWGSKGAAAAVSGAGSAMGVSGAGTGFLAGTTRFLGFGGLALTPSDVAPGTLSASNIPGLRQAYENAGQPGPDNTASGQGFVSRLQTEPDFAKRMQAENDDLTQRLQEMLTSTKVGGEIAVTVTSAPGVQTQTELRPNDGTRMKGNVGRTNVNTD